jgi:hypothetical protein
VRSFLQCCLSFPPTVRTLFPSDRPRSVMDVFSSPSELAQPGNFVIPKSSSSHDLRLQQLLDLGAEYLESLQTAHAPQHLALDGKILQSTSKRIFTGCPRNTAFTRWSGIVTEVG